MAQPMPKPAAAKPELRHVIAQYRHRMQTVDCECGWTGSSASVGGQPSEWARHLAANRIPTRH